MTPIMLPRPSGNGRPDTAHEVLGRRLRELRKACGISPRVAGKHLDCSESKITRLELGKVAVKNADLHRLLTLYRVGDTEERQALHDLNVRLHQPNWWHRPGTNDLAEWYCSYLVLESVAWWIGTYESRFIPGLLQTRAYAERVIRSRYEDETMVRRLVDIRMQRQSLVLSDGAPQLWAIVDEAALKNNFGSEIMREQVKFLLQVAQKQHVSVQVVRLQAGAHAERSNSFSILRLRGNMLSDVVYLEHLDRASFLTDPNDSEPYRQALVKIGCAAEKPQQTQEVLEKELRGLEDG